MEPILVELGPGGATAEESPHEGEEFGYVLSGALKIAIGERVVRAKKDESFYFLPTGPHSIKNAGKTTARFCGYPHRPVFSARRSAMNGQPLGRGGIREIILYGGLPLWCRTCA